MFGRLFGRKGREGRDPKDIVLRLKYEPVPENAPAFAADIAESARKIDGSNLDYAPASLALVDDIIEGFRGEGMASSQVGETLFGFGCYVGEVFVRNAGGQWRRTEETPMRDFAGHAFVIQLPSGTYCNPLAKVFKRLDNGPEDSLAYFYQVFTSPTPSDNPER
jgi:hypothetical protein